MFYLFYWISNWCVSISGDGVTLLLLLLCSKLIGN